MLIGGDKETIIIAVLHVSEFFFSTKAYAYRKQAPRNLQYPILMATQDDYFAQVIPLGAQMYELALHHSDLLNLKINLNLVHTLLATPPSALSFVIIQNSLTLLTTLESIHSTTILSFTQLNKGEEFYETSSFEVPAPNCASSLAASQAYLAVGCSHSNILHVFHLTTRNLLCSITGPGQLFATDLAIFQHPHQSATIYASGVNSGIHFIAEIHVLPSYNQHSISCELNPVSNILALDLNLQRPQLEVELVDSFLFVLLQSSELVYPQQTKRMALYHHPLNTLVETSLSPCAPSQYSITTVNSQECFDCADYISPSSDPVRAAIRASKCSTSLNCASPTLHGPLCLECTDYMPSIGATLKPNSYWQNGEICLQQCISGFSFYQLTGQCELEQWVSAVSADPCRAYSHSCTECALHLCLYNGSVCITDQHHYIQSYADVLKQCPSSDVSFCGPQTHTLDFSQSSFKITLKPNGSGILRAKKSTVCIWDLVYQNRLPEWGYALFYRILTPGSRYPSVFRAPLTLKRSGTPDFVHPEWQKEIISQVTFPDDTGIRIGIVFHEDMSDDPVQVVIQADSGAVVMPTPGIHHTSPIVPQSSSSSLKTGDMIGIIVGGMVGACALCCVLFWIRKMMKRSRSRASMPRIPQVRVVGIVRIPNGNESNSKNQEVCSICMEEFKKNFAQTVCGHHFHRDCLRGWLRAHNDCPLCRQILT